MEKEIFSKIRVLIHQNYFFVIISLHTPKTAGLSFKKVLKDHFEDHLIEEYIDLPLLHSTQQRQRAAIKSKILFNLYRRYNFERKGYKCIHGHFLPYKFTGPAAKGIKYVTWLRDPIERMCSHYYYWLRTYKEDRSPRLQTRIVKEKWSLEDFCLSVEFRNVYDQYLWRFPLEKFNFIGITEYFEEDLRYFAREFLNLAEPKIPFENANSERQGRKYDLEAGLIDRIRDFHQKDFEIYHYALKERNKRLKLYQKDA